MGQITAALWKEGEMEKDLKISANDKTSTEEWRERERRGGDGKLEGQKAEREGVLGGGAHSQRKDMGKKKRGEEKIADKKCEKGTRTKQTIEGE